MGAVFTVRTRRRGFYPRGGGGVDLLCTPLEKKLKPLTLIDRGDVKSVTIKRYAAPLYVVLNGHHLTSFSHISFVSGRIPVGVAERMTNRAEQRLTKYFGGSASVMLRKMIARETRDSAVGDGTAIFLTADTTTG